MTDGFEISTKFEFKKFKKLFEKEFQNLNIYVKLTILATINKNVIREKRNLSDFKIQLARKIRTDVLSLYRKMSSFGAPVQGVAHALVPKRRNNSKYVHGKGKPAERMNVEKQTTDKYTTDLNKQS